jgi:DnaJ family protein B protein 13
MGKDYYQVLGINRDAQDADIAKSYKTLALKWHPKLSKFDPDVTYHNFSEISEAYEVLGDPYKRAFYDKYGEEKLKDGFLVDGNFKGGYRFGGNPEQIFEKFFGSTNPFANLVDNEGKEELGSLFGFAFGGLNYQGVKSVKTLDVLVECSLNELYNGCSKTVTYTKSILNADGQTTRDIQETKILDIKPGFNSTSILNFQGLGNEAAGLPTSDLVFKIKELPHSEFKRKGNDLIYTAKVSLADALCCEPVSIVTLDSRHVHISIDEIITPKYIKKVTGEGMPIHNEKIDSKTFNKKLDKGDLFIKFDIDFPKSLSEDQKSEIKKCLAP